MAKIEYQGWKPGSEAREAIAQANAICREYQLAGYDLTLRQLFYQFVSRDLIPNSQQSYKRLGDIINKARLAGLMDWNYIIDRTRNLQSLSHWSTPGEIIRSAAQSCADVAPIVTGSNRSIRCPAGLPCSYRCGARDAWGR